MAKISNTTVYPQIQPTDTDLLIITDSSDSNETKTVSVGDLGKYYTYSTKEITITANQLLNLFTNPVVILEPGIKEIIQVTNVVAQYNYGGDIIVWPGIAHIYNGINSSTYAPFIFDALSLWGANDSITSGKQVAHQWPVLGAKVYLGGTVANPNSPGTPTGDVKLSLTYRVIQF